MNALRGGLLAETDRTLWVFSALLTLCGLITIFSTTSATESALGIHLLSQSIKVILGFGLFVIAHRIDYHLWKDYAPWIYVAGILILILVFAPGIGGEVRDVHRWIQLPMFRVQAADPARLALIICLARILSKSRAHLERPRTGIVPCALALGLMAGLIVFQPNLSTVVALCLITVLMLAVGRIPWKHLLAPLGFFVIAASLVARSYQFDRLTNWIGYWTRGDALQAGNYQLHQSIIALGSGGLLGQGLGESRQKWSFLPDAHTDFIFAIVGEEFGFVGVMVVIALVLTILWRTYEASRRAPDLFGRLLAAGIGISIAVYATVNISVVTGIIPTTGLPLPLFSYGGSSVIVTLFSLGIVSNIATQAELWSAGPWKERYDD